MTPAEHIDHGNGVSTFRARGAEQVAEAVTFIMRVITERVASRGLAMWQNFADIDATPHVILVIGPKGKSPVTDRDVDSWADIRVGVPFCTQAGVSYLSALASMLDQDAIPIEAVHAAACTASELVDATIAQSAPAPSPMRSANTAAGHRHPRRPAERRSHPSGRPRR